MKGYRETVFYRVSLKEEIFDKLPDVYHKEVLRSFFYQYFKSNGAKYVLSVFKYARF